MACSLLLGHKTRSIKDPNEVACAFNNFFLSILEN